MQPSDSEDAARPSMTVLVVACPTCARGRVLDVETSLVDEVERLRRGADEWRDAVLSARTARDRADADLDALRTAARAFLFTVLQSSHIVVANLTETETARRLAGLVEMAWCTPRTPTTAPVAAPLAEQVRALTPFAWDVVDCYPCGIETRRSFVLLDEVLALVGAAPGADVEAACKAALWDRLAAFAAEHGTVSIENAIAAVDREPRP